MTTDSHHDEIIAALASINAANILIPGGPQEHYHVIIEEAYIALGLIETEIDVLSAELEHQHARLDEAISVLCQSNPATSP